MLHRTLKSWRGTYERWSEALAGRRLTNWDHAAIALLLLVLVAINLRETSIVNLFVIGLAGMLLIAIGNHFNLTRGIKRGTNTATRLIDWIDNRMPGVALVVTVTGAMAMFIRLLPDTHRHEAFALYTLLYFVLICAILLMTPTQVRLKFIDQSTWAIYRKIVPGVLFKIWLFLMFTYVAIDKIINEGHPYWYLVTSLVITAGLAVATYLWIRKANPWFQPSILVLFEKMRPSLSRPQEVLFIVTLTGAVSLIWYLTGDSADKAVVVGGTAALVAGIIGMWAPNESWVREIAPELISISIGIMIFDQIYAARAAKYAIQQERDQLSFQLTSTNPIAVSEALRMLRETNRLDQGLLSDADLRNAQFGGQDLSGANLSGADLTDADLRSTKLANTNLSGARLQRADLRNTDLRTANLRAAVLTGALYDERTLWPAGVDNRTAVVIPANTPHVQDTAAPPAIITPPYSDTSTGVIPPVCQPNNTWWIVPSAYPAGERNMLPLTTTVAPSAMPTAPVSPIVCP